MIISLNTSNKRRSAHVRREGKSKLESNSANFYKYGNAHIDYEDIENGGFMAIAAAIHMLVKAADNEPNDAGYRMPPATERAWNSFVKWVEQGKHLEQELKKAYLLEVKD